MGDPTTGPTAKGERRSWWAGVAVIGVFLLIGAASLGYSLYRPSPAASGVAPEETSQQVVLIAASFADERNGHLVVAVCENRQTCTTELRVTEDSGRRWTARELPVVGGRSVGLEDGFALYSLGADRIVVDAPGALNSETNQATEPGYRFYTEDGGQTWDKRPRKPSGTVPDVPATGWLFYPVPDPADRPAGSSTAIKPQVLRSDGTAATLAKGPTYAKPSTTPVTFASDGSIWATAATPPSVSRDRGRTWQPIPMPKMDKGATGAVRTSDGTHAYAIVNTPEGVLLYSTADAGKKWERLTPPSSSGTGSANGGPTFAEVPNGAFLVQVGADTFVYKVGETTPSEVSVTGVAFGTLAAVHRAVIAIAGTDQAPSFFVSLDGETWIPIALRAGG